MKILVNATNTRMGGGIQKAVEFVRASLSYPSSHVFSYALSDVVAENLRALSDVDRPENLIITNVSPSRPLAGRAARRQLHDLEERFRPDVVFSILGPPYKIFRSPHLMGFAVPWVTHPNQHAWKTFRNPIEKATFWAWCKHVEFWARFADRWVLETSVAADGLSRVLDIERGRFHVVPNVYGEAYSRARANGICPDIRMGKRDPSDFNLLVFSRWYRHKNLELIPSVAAQLRKRDSTRQYRFFLTFDQASRPWMTIQREARRLGVQENVINLGPVLVTEGPGLYASSDAVFLPTLLETSTANYPEAMCSRRPIVTTDLPFARDICHRAALYFPPNDSVSAADRIASLAESDAIKDELLKRGEEWVARAETPRQVYEMFIEALEITARHRQGGLGRGEGQ